MDKIVPEETRKQKREQKKLERQFIKKDRVISQFDRVDYSTLEDNGMPKNLDPDIDWTGLDGKKDEDAVDPNVDFSDVR